MPIYEYKCTGCAARTEKMQKVSDAPLTVCEKCGGRLEKQWSLSGFQFKGVGWYVTDYAGRGKSEAKIEGAAETKSKAESETKNDSPASAEKNSAAESTAKSESASKVADNKPTASKKD